MSVFQNIRFVFVYVIATYLLSHTCYGGDVSLRLSSDDVVFEGVPFDMVCSVSDSSPDDPIQMVITNSSGNEINSVLLPEAQHYSRESVPVAAVSRNQTFICSVSWTERPIEDDDSLSIVPEPLASPSCYSNYTDGVIDGDVIKLTCYSMLPREGVAYLIWGTEDGAADLGGVLSNVWNSVGKRELVTSQLSQNASTFICGVLDTGMYRSCSIGPINVYDAYSVYVEPDAVSTPRTLVPGQTRTYRCVSFPSTDTEWSWSFDTETSGIDITRGGSSVTVSVHADSTFIGEISLSCSVVREKHEASTTIVLSITEQSQFYQNTIIFIIIGIFALIVVVLVIASIIYIMIHRKGAKETTVMPNQHDSMTDDDRAYDSPPVRHDDTGNEDLTSRETNEDQETYDTVDKLSRGTVAPADDTYSPCTRQDMGDSLGRVNIGLEELDEPTGGQEIESHGLERLSVVYAQPKRKEGVSPMSNLGDKQKIHAGES